MPKYTVLTPSDSRLSHKSGSSPHSTAVPPGRSPSRISSFALQIPSREPRNSMCDTPMLVMTATSGCACTVMREISPKSDMPISSTAASVSSSMRNTVSGMPISLFRLPCVYIVRNFAFSTAAVISLVVVLPTEPVMPTTGMENSDR